MTDSSAARFGAYTRLTRELSAPIGVLDGHAFDHNIADMLRRAAGTSIRVATKSIRCRPAITHLLAQDGINGALTLTLAESLALHAAGVHDILLGYPTGDIAALQQMARLDDEFPVVLMVDSLEHIDFLRTHLRPNAARPMRVCLELDASLRIGSRVHLGVRRSPLHSPTEFIEFAQQVARHRDVRIEGIMAYEAQIAGISDNAGSLRGAALRAMKMASRRDIRERRARAVAGVGALTELRFVNGGGTGSIESTRGESCVTEVGAGSGFFGPALFDHYATFTPQPAVYFGVNVVRRPSPDIIAVQGGGWIASGPHSADRYPTIAWPPDLDYLPLEGPGEAQTPLVGPSAATLAPGDRVWFRHAKSGEVCEHLNELQVIRDDAVVGSWKTYRGEGHAFL